MPANDVIALRANFESWLPRMEGITDIDPWLYYCVEQFMKPYAMADEDILSGITEGGDDGGADAIFFLVNSGALVSDDTELHPKNVSAVRLIFLQIKKSGGFRTNEIAKIVPTLNDFLDLSKEPQTFAQKYNSDVIRAMRIFKEKYLKIIGAAPELTIEYFYITGDDAPPPDAKAIAAMDDAKAKVLHHFGKATFKEHYIGAQQIWEQAQKRPAQDRVLTWSENPMPAREGMVGLVKLSDYYGFLKDETGEIAERIFESNVRGFQPGSAVNNHISDTLKNPPKANFWLLNNGVTIVSAKIGSAGHLRVSLRDPQIVNGLQTSRTIFSYFKHDGGADNGRTLLVRLIETDDDEVRDRVIRATNSQNKMQDASLRMTDPIHREIEEVFKKYGLHYDRRKGFYKDQGIPMQKIVSANALAQSVISILLQRPDDARARPGKYFKDDSAYKSVFESDGVPLPMYLICIRMIQKIDVFLKTAGIARKDITNIRFYVAMALACDLTTEVKPSADDIVTKINPETIDNDAIQKAITTVWSLYESLSEEADRDDIARGGDLLELLLDKIHADWREEDDGEE